MQDFRRDAADVDAVRRAAAGALEPPDYFKTEQPIAEMMTVAAAPSATSQELAASGVNVVPLAVELHKKLAFPFVTFVMTLLAVPFGVSTGRRGTLYGIGLGIVIALSYWIVISAFVAIGKGGLLQPAPGGVGPQYHGRRDRRVPVPARANLRRRQALLAHLRRNLSRAPRSDRWREARGDSASRSIRSAICRASTDWRAGDSFGRRADTNVPSPAPHVDRALRARACDTRAERYWRSPSVRRQAAGPREAALEA